MTRRSLHVVPGAWRCSWMPPILVLLIVVISALPALAQPTTANQVDRGLVTFNLPAQQLTSALHAFAEATGLQVSFPSGLASGQTSPEVAGVYAPEAALDKLLAGTGLTYRFIDARTITLLQAPAATPPPPRTPEPVSSSPAETPLPAAKEKPLKVEEVMVTATRSQRPLAAIPEAVTVITREQIEKQTVLSRSLVDVLGKMVPGFAVGGQSLSNTGQTLRGRNALVLIDGVPQSTMRNAARDLSTIDPSAIERIEVLRGATSIYGDGATGGIIHIITKKPGEGKPSFTTDVLANTAPTNPTAGIGGRVVQSLAGKNGIFDYSLSGSYERVGGLFDGRGDRIPPDLLSAQGGLADLHTYNLFGKFGLDLGPQHIQLSINHFNAEQDSDYVTDFSNVTAGKGVTKKGLVLDDQSGTRNSVVNLDYSRANLLGSKVNAQTYYRDYSTRFFPFDGRTNAALGNNIIQSRVLSEKWGGRITIETPLPVATTFKPTLIWGMDAAREKTSQRVALMDPTTFANSGQVAFQQTGDRTWVPPMTQRNLGLYAQLELKLHERWLVRGGVRHERIGIDVDAFTTLRGRSIMSGSRDFDATLFNAGTVVYVTDAVNVFANYSEGFSIPDVGLIIRDAPVGFSFSDSQLAPIKVDHYEVGIRGDWSQVQSSLVGYYNESLFGVTSAGFFANVVRAPERVYGVEGTLDVQLEEWGVGGTATYVEGENDINRTGDFKYLNGFRVPPLKVTAYVEHLTVPAWNWRNRLQALYSGTRDPGLGPAVFGGRPVHSFTVLDLISTVKTGPGTLRFGVENLLNSQYYLPVAQLQRAGPASLTAARGMLISLGYSMTW